MPVHTLKTAGSSRVEIHHHGAHVTAWTDSSGRPVIYTSPTAILTGDKPIRGGIPICFPQFGKNGPLSQHGFARNLPWTLDSAHTSPTNGSAATRFILESNTSTLASAWPYNFHITYTVTLSPDGNTLSIDMAVTNKDKRSFSFTTALHSYFTCDAPSTTLPDFDSITYTDSLHTDDPGPKTQSGDVSFGKEVDRVYINTPSTITIPSAGLSITKKNLPEAVVWNPYIEKAAAMSDLPDNAWKSFICIEPARIADPVIVDPGQSWSCQLTLTSSLAA